ncbi:MAG: molybdate ABC transporter substrate-binding protein [Acidimicrobiales bacterium]
MRRHTRLLAASLVLTSLVLAACVDDDEAASTTAAAVTTVAVTEAPTTEAPATTEASATTEAAATTTEMAMPMAQGTITVFAAASLTAAFTEIGDAFMVANPDAEVVFNFAASSDLVTQITEGAPADVFASADQKNMTKLTDAAANSTDPVVIATNLLEIIVGPGNPKGITGVADLANQDLIVVTCDPEVPCGKYANEIFANAGVTVTSKSLEENVKAVVTKVTLGEADAGIVYKTDVTAAGADAEGVEIPADINVLAEYPIAATAEATNPDGAQAFIDFVLSEQGQKIMQSYGFLAP